jgi:hypothetical protein
MLSLNTEYVENDIFPPTDIVEDWLKLIDYDSENVVKVWWLNLSNSSGATQSTVRC